MNHDMSDISDFLKNNPRETWKNGISKMILSEDKENHKCTILESKFDTDTFEAEFSLDSLDPNFRVPVEEHTLVQDSKGNQYFVSYIPALDNRREGAYQFNHILDCGDKTELVSLNKGEGPFIAPLGYDMVYIAPNSTEYKEITEDDIDSEFRQQLQDWLDGKFVI